MKDYCSSIKKALKYVMVHFDKYKHGFLQKVGGGRGSPPDRTNEANKVRGYFWQKGGGRYRGDFILEKHSKENNFNFIVAL